MHNLYYSPMINVVNTAQSNPAAILMISKQALSAFFLRQLIVIPSPQFPADPDYFPNNSYTVHFFTR
jgi:hypothetical protein